MQSKSNNMNIRVAPKVTEEIENCVNAGYAKNKTEFVNIAIRNEIARCKAGA